MKVIRCVRCNEPLDERSRADRRTCSVRCRVALWRRRRARIGREQEYRVFGPTDSRRSPTGRRSRYIAGHREDTSCLIPAVPA